MKGGGADGNELAVPSQAARDEVATLRGDLEECEVPPLRACLPLDDGPDLYASNVPCMQAQYEGGFWNPRCIDCDAACSCLAQPNFLSSAVPVPTNLVRCAGVLLLRSRLLAARGKLMGVGT